MYIDTHAHIYVDQFNNDFNDVIIRAEKSKVSQILMPNLDFNSIVDVLNRASTYPLICKPMIGLHPCSVKEDWEKILTTIEPYIHKEGVIGIGETGIDLYWDNTFAKEQEESFRQQISWSLTYNLPIVIHSRAAIDHTIRIVSEMQNGSLRGVFHCFDQNIEHAKKIMDLGFFMGIGGVITYKKNNELREAISKIPMEYIVLETDAPYLPPTPHRGKRNESSYIPIIAEKLATCYNCDIRKVAEITTYNAKQLFKL